MKSFRPKDGSGGPPGPSRNGERDFRQEKRSNATHASTTDPDARLYRKADGQESRLCYLGHALMENRNGLVVDASLTQATDVFAAMQVAQGLLPAERSIGHRTGQFFFGRNGCSGSMRSRLDLTASRLLRSPANPSVPPGAVAAPRVAGPFALLGCRRGGRCA